jgi:hypothetical protein
MNAPPIALGDAAIRQEPTCLHLQAGLLQRRCSLGSRGAVTEAIRVGSHELALAEPRVHEMECSYDGLTYLRRRRQKPWVDLELGGTQVEPVAATALDPAHVRAIVDWADPRQRLTLRRHWMALPQVNTLLTWASVRSPNAPQVDCGGDDYLNIVETLPLNLAGWHLTAVLFRGQTDLTNDVMSRQQLEIVAGAAPIALTGNLLILQNRHENAGLFVLHDGAPHGERRRECATDFVVSDGGVIAMSWGLAPHELAEVDDDWRSSNSVAIGAFDPAAASPLEALRRFVQVRYPVRGQERAIVVNPWGDRRLYQQLNESFVLRELEATAAIGADAYQIDDGWQAGGVLSNLCNENWVAGPGFWDICPRRFPNGFDPIARRAAELNVRLALWFAPDTNAGYRTWQRERDLLLDMHRRYGMDLFKIDGIRLRTHDAQRRLVMMLESVIEQSGGIVRFNLDITADRRLGHFGSLRYGNLFVENRYVMVNAKEHNNYHPYSTLRNLWRLAHYVPPEKMQFEFANVDHTIWHAPLRDRTNPLDGTQHGWDYLAAVALMACPLCWFEPSDLSAAATQGIRRVLDLHHRIKDELLTGCTLPIGAEPDGRSWTGLQCLNQETPTRGLVQVFREFNDQPTARLPMHRVRSGQSVSLQCLSHDEPGVTVTADEGGVPFAIARDRDFRLYRYEIALRA